MISLDSLPVHNDREGCGQAAAMRDVTLIRSRKSRNTVHMTILPRMIAIGLRKYAAQPEQRAAAARMLVINAARLSLECLSVEEVDGLVDQAKRERKA